MAKTKKNKTEESKPEENTEERQTTSTSSGTVTATETTTASSEDSNESKPQKEQGKDPETTSFDELVKNQDKDFGKFLEIKHMVGELPDHPPDETEQKQLIVDYNNWVKDGRPKPKLPKTTKEELSPVEKVYRRKHLGTQYLTWITKDGKAHGVERIAYYREGPDGKDDLTMELGTKPKYTVKYTKERGEKLVEHAMNECIEPKFFFVEGHKFAVKDPEKNFNGDFDELIRKARKLEVI